MNKVFICIMLALVLIYISKFLINVKEGMRRSKEERKESRSEKKEAKSEKKADKKDAKSEKKASKKEAKSEKKAEKKEAKTEKKAEKKEAKTEKTRNFATSSDQDILGDQLCTQISKNQFSDDDIDVANLNKVIEELKREDKINNANKDTILKYIQHIRVLKLRINNEILYKTKFSDVFNFGDDDGTEQDIVSILSNVDSAIKKKTDVINQLNILEKSLIDHYNYHKRLLGNQ